MPIRVCLTSARYTVCARTTTGQTCSILTVTRQLAALSQFVYTRTVASLLLSDFYPFGPVMPTGTAPVRQLLPELHFPAPQRKSAIYTVGKSA